MFQLTGDQLMASRKLAKKLIEKNHVLASDIPHDTLLSVLQDAIKHGEAAYNAYNQGVHTLDVEFSRVDNTEFLRIAYRGKKSNHRLMAD